MYEKSNKLYSKIYHLFLWQNRLQILWKLLYLENFQRTFLRSHFLLQLYYELQTGLKIWDSIFGVKTQLTWNLEQILLVGFRDFKKKKSGNMKTFFDQFCFQHFLLYNSIQSTVPRTKFRWWFNQIIIHLSWNVERISVLFQV